jgi:hypothetical protein
MADLHERLTAAVTERLDVARAATPGPWSRYGNLGYAVFTEAYDDPDYDPPAVTHGSDMEADAEYIALHDPADAIRRYERDLRVLERHRPAADEPGLCAWCFAGDDYLPYPCPEIRDLALAYEVELTE